MAVSKKCPRCDSRNIKLVSCMGSQCVYCYDCEYDESVEYNVYPEARNSQREKTRHSPYKSGRKLKS